MKVSSQPDFRGSLSEIYVDVVCIIVLLFWVFHRKYILKVFCNRNKQMDSTLWSISYTPDKISLDHLCTAVWKFFCLVLITAVAKWALLCFSDRKREAQRPWAQQHHGALATAAAHGAVHGSGACWRSWYRGVAGGFWSGTVQGSWGGSQYGYCWSCSLCTACGLGKKGESQIDWMLFNNH